MRLRALVACVLLLGCQQKKELVVFHATSLSAVFGDVAAVPESPAPRRPRVDWATLLRHTFGCHVWRCPCGGQRRVVAVVTRRRTAEEMLRNMGMFDVAPPLPQAPGLHQLALLQERPQQAAAPGVDVGGLVCATSDELQVSPSPFSPSFARPVRRRSRATAPPRGFEPSIFLTFLNFQATFPLVFPLGRERGGAEHEATNSRSQRRHHPHPPRGGGLPGPTVEVHSRRVTRMCGAGGV